MIKTLIFDLGKVIVPFDIERLQHLAKYSELGPADIKSSLLSAPETRAYETGQMSSAGFHNAISERLKLNATFDEFASVWNGIFDLEPLIGGEFIAGLKKRYRLMILSDTNELHFEFIRASFPVLRHFDGFCLSFETGFIKPSGDSFGAALRLADCFPEECLFIDDKPANVEAAMEFGMKGIQFVDEEGLLKDLSKMTGVHF